MRALLLVAAVLVSAVAVPAQAATPTTYAVRGLDQPVRMVVDKWGVPHIYALNSDDLFLAQGFNAARDRLFQMDLWRKRGLGQLAESFGPAWVAQDHAARMLLYRGDMEREWASYGPQAKQTITEFVNGINAYVDWVGQNPQALPEEFRKLGHKPARWAPEDVVRIRSHGLVRNLYSEIMRAMTTCLAGLDADRVRANLEPKWTTKVPDGLDACAVTENAGDVINTYRLGTQAVSFKGQKLELNAAEQQEGSNNWVIGAKKSETGRPVLANDPHRVLPAPSGRYIQHLSAPGLDVIGAGEPILPGVSIGHNGTAAFGLTIFSIDQEDLYVEQLDPANHGRYRFKDTWEPVRTVKEKIAVKGEAAREVDLNFTRHGVVLHTDQARHQSYALRSVWFEPGTSPYLGSLKYMGVKNLAQFREVMRTWGGPPENQVYADTKGDIAWLPGGMAPKRPAFDGLLPVPGDGRYEWEGYYDGEQLPRSVNPAKGFLATANEENLPEDYPRDRKLGYEWADPFRSQRIHEVLGSKEKLSIQDSERLQNDQLSVVARRVTAALKDVTSTDPVAAKALQSLRGWNHVLDAKSGPAALYEVWRVKHLGAAVIAATVPALAQLGQAPDPEVVLDVIEHPERWLGQDAKAKRDKLVVDTLAAAWRDTEKRLGADPAAWQWGTLHQTLFQHPLSGHLPNVDVGPFPRGGSADTPDAASFGPDFKQTGGASFRMVLDVGNWDASRAINTPGQSGDPASKHYRDLASTWHKGEYFPLLYSRAAVERNATKVILLLPRR
ncbi:penicillin acylase family protein [Allokutzneria sp. A3M-2-11 16]|uniref:penicillin acylase family protein n=1 Tax=Allokutzneria sp. A3M-2-11 16 TaxID=2962043 RepID=UPI0020B7A3E4|nr:penicillin acylase family protein [Allokutzneria sp. A3M-2-11 16]MCP3798187.1 penicillin acylase family protein [Allokutzneria sp. A3M-2-11 16]